MGFLVRTPHNVVNDYPSLFDRSDRCPYLQANIVGLPILVTNFFSVLASDYLSANGNAQVKGIQEKPVAASH